MFITQRVLNELNILARLNWRKHAIMMAIYAFFIAYVHYSIYQDEANGSGKLSFFPVQLLTYLPLILFAILISVDIFKQLRDPIGGIQYMLTPSSILEKFIASWLYSCILTFVACIATYIVTHTISALLINVFTDIHFAIIPKANSNPASFLGSSNMPLLFYSWSDFAKIGLTFINVQALFLLGSAFFKKNPLIKTILVYLAFSALMGLGGMALLKSFGIENTRTIIQNTHEFQQVSGKMLPENIESALKTLGITFQIVFPLLAWYLTYLTLKLKQL